MVKDRDARSIDPRSARHPRLVTPDEFEAWFDATFPAAEKAFRPADVIKAGFTRSCVYRALQTGELPSFNMATLQAKPGKKQKPSYIIPRAWLRVWLLRRHTLNTPS